MLGLFSKTKYAFLLAIFLFLTYMVQSEVDDRGSAALNQLQRRSEIMALNKITGKSRNDELLMRGQVGITGYISNKLFRPFIESRLDYHIAQLGFSSFIRDHMDITHGLNMHDTKIGDGKLVMCGSVVDAVITEPSSMDMGVARMSAIASPNERRFIVGQGLVPRGIELGVIGMREGGERAVTIPRALSVSRVDQDSQGHMLTATYGVKILSVKSHYSDSIASMYSIDNKRGLEREVLCGDRVLFSVRVMDQDGQIVYASSNPLSSRLGEYTTHPAIEFWLIGMHKGGKRMFVMPADLANSLADSYANSPISFSKSGVSLVEMEVLDVMG